MGSFIGHAIPGTFFIVFGSWWIIQTFRRFFQSHNRGSEPFRCTPTYPPHLKKWRSLDLEALVVIISGVTGIFVEIIAACFMRHMPVGVTNTQHATMYFFFAMAGTVSLLAPKLKHLIPDIENVRYSFVVLAYTTEALLFKFHLFGRQDMDVVVHTLLLYTVYAAILSLFLEMQFRNNVLCSISRAYFTVLQGTWFYQVGFDLYDPLHPTSAHMSIETAEHMDAGAMHHGHMATMFVTCKFAWHMAALAIVTLLTGIGIGSWYRKHGNFSTSDFTLLPSNGYALVSEREPLTAEES